MSTEKIYETRPCSWCGVDFSTSKSYQKYCSRECSREKHLKECRKVENKTTPYMKLRFKVLERDGFRCTYCGAIPDDGVTLEVDHVIPRASGGTNVVSNLITACNLCNLGKSDVLLSRRSEEIIRKRIARGVERRSKKSRGITKVGKKKAPKRPKRKK